MKWLEDPEDGGAAARRLATAMAARFALIDLESESEEAMAAAKHQWLMDHGLVLVDGLWGHEKYVQIRELLECLASEDDPTAVRHRAFDILGLILEAPTGDWSFEGEEGTNEPGQERT